jgi:hypothetical protein
LAIALVVFAASSSRPALAAIVALAGLILFAWSLKMSLTLAFGNEHRLAAVAALAVVLGSMMSPLSTVPDSIDSVRPLLLALGVTACVVTFVGGARLGGKRLAVALGLLIVLIATGALAATEWNSNLGTDIYHAHRAAGAALIEGENPYTDAVRFFDGSPYRAEDRVIEGYPYPPVVLSTYGLAGAFTDPRLVSALAWIGFIGWLGWRGARFEHGSEVALGVFLVLATLPIWSMVWYAAWTEPLSIVLIALAAVSWRRRVVVASFLLGLALASKQYLVFLAPLVIFHRDEMWLKRLAIGGGTALATVLPFLLLDAGGLVASTIGNLAEIGFRPDTQSIPGLLGAFGIEFNLPVWAWLFIGVLIGALVGITARSASLFAGRAGLTLGLVFIVGLAFANYWVLVAGLFSIAAVLDAHDDSVFERIAFTRRRTVETVSSQLT